MKIAEVKVIHENISDRTIIHTKHENGKHAWEMIKFNNKNEDSYEEFMRNKWKSAPSEKHLENYFSYPMNAKDWNEWGEHFNMNINPVTLWNKYMKRVNQLLVNALSEKKIIFNHVNGHKVDVARYLKGHPKNMKKRKQGEKHSEIIEVFVLNSTYHSYEPQYRIHIQAIISAIISGLEIYGGYKINLTAGRIATRGYTTTVHEIKLKRPAEKLSLQQHGFILLSQSVQQILGWGTEYNYLNHDKRLRAVSHVHTTMDTDNQITVAKNDRHLRHIVNAGIFKENTIVFNLNMAVLSNLNTESLFIDDAEEKFIIDLMNDFIKAIGGKENV